MKKKTYFLMPGDDFNIKVHLNAKTYTVLRIEAIEIENPESENSFEDLEL